LLLRSAGAHFSTASLWSACLAHLYTSLRFKLYSLNLYPTPQIVAASQRRRSFQYSFAVERLPCTPLHILTI
jgi:hypothetical protein